MSYEIIYFNQRVRDGIHAWPATLKARYFALILRMKEFGPNLGMPHTRPIARERMEQVKRHEEN